MRRALLVLSAALPLLLTGCSLFAPQPTPTPVPTNTPMPTDTPVPTDTPIPTQTPAPTAAPRPTKPPTAVPPTQPPDPCAGIPADRDGRIEPKCGNRSTRFCMDIWGFTPNEQFGFWLDSDHGIIGGTYQTATMSSDGTYSNLCFRPEESWLDLQPGLYWWVFQGVSSGHQSVLYFKVIP